MMRNHEEIRPVQMLTARCESVLFTLQMLDKGIDSVLGGAAGLAGGLLGRAHSAGRQVAGSVCSFMYHAMLWLRTPKYAQALWSSPHY
jgi:hypothetical protein